MASTIELLADCKNQLGAQVPRIHELRVKKAEDPLAFFEGDAGTGAAEIPDNVSLAPTDASTMGGGSLFTRYTSRTGTTGTNATRTTSKNRRREERKRARGKKGSVYEEEYLVNSIGRLVHRVNNVGDEVGRLVVGLTRRGMSERARAVNRAMEDLVALCRSAVADVFGEAEAGKGTREPRMPESAEDSSNPFPQSPPGGQPSEIPIVKPFERLSLLG
jgi:elongator complex protein 1